MRFVIGLALVIALARVGSAQVEQPQTEDATEAAAFAAFLAEIRTAASQRGIDDATLDAVLPSIRIHRRAIQADRSQAEFVETYETYLSRRVTPQRIDRGRALLAEQGEMIRRVTADYGVQPRFVAAIIGLESNYGTYPIEEPLFDVLATLAFDGRRGAQFRTQLLAALEIVAKGYAKPEELKSSWAGALGVPQFTPTNVLEIAVDHDKDGHIDLWKIGPDVIASVAHYLQRTGWRADQTWGRAVALPAGGEQSLAAAMRDGVSAPRVCRSYESHGAFRGLKAWQQLGVRAADGGDLPARNLDAALIIGDEGDDRGWLVYGNFCSLMRYNPAFRYALSVGLLADALGAADR
ncbi:MAG TPA: lytic murein transglycosylase [Gammaproteobacteria bacterium]|nr:lytic murein transglycosylase [Gammaproteobacteria bacterium]